MSTKTIDIPNLTRGNDVTLTFTVNSTIAIATAKFAARRTTKTPFGLTPAGSEVASKVVATTLNADGQITTAGPPTATIQIILSKNDTAAFTAGAQHLWDLEVFDSTGKATTPIGGTVVLADRARSAIG